MSVSQRRLRRSLALPLAGAALLALELTAHARPATPPSRARVELAGLQPALARLSRAYAPDGASAPLRPRLLERGAVQRLLSLSARDLSARAGCITVTLLAHPDASYYVLLGGDGTEERLSSTAGLVQVARCGERRQELQGLRVGVRSPRLILEGLLTRSQRPVPAADAVLQERRDAAPRGLPAPEPPLVAGPLPARLAAARQAAEVAGATHVELVPLAHGLRAGSVPVDVAAGCHTFRLLARPPRQAAERIDLDAELYDDAGRLLSSDVTESPDARVEGCVGTPRRLWLKVRGAPTGEDVTLLRASWPLPAGWPDDWPEAVQGRVAHVARESGQRGLARRPVFERLGGHGAWRLPVPARRSGCYVAVLTPWDDAELEAGSLEALAGAAPSVAPFDPDVGSAWVAYCAHGQRSVTLRVTAFGPRARWLLAVWPAAEQRSEAALP